MEIFDGITRLRKLITKAQEHGSAEREGLTIEINGGVLFYMLEDADGYIQECTASEAIEHLE